MNEQNNKTNSIIKTILVALISMLTTYSVINFNAVNTANSGNFDKVMSEYDKQLKRQDEQITLLREQIQNCEENFLENVRLKIEVGQLKTENKIIGSAYDSYPYPMWIKDSEGKMIYCNKSYEKKYLQPKGFTRDDYIGAYDEKIWGKDIANEFRINDNEVLRRGKPITRREPIGNGETVIVTKSPFKVNSVVFGIMGVEYEYYDFKLAMINFQID